MFIEYYHFFIHPIHYIFNHFFIINIKILKLNVIFVQYNRFFIYPTHFLFNYSII